jgi:hypothetical protein
MSSRHACPIFVTSDGQLTLLARQELGRGDDDSKRREEFIQELVYDHPAIIPMADIEPAMSPLVSVCRELPVAGYSVDNFWITPWGGLVVGECKLVRNPQARREVVAQVLDYARIIAGWSYEDLERAAQQARREPTFRLWSLVESLGELDEAQFVDAVERRLRAGRILLLVIGDGIQEGVEALTSHLQLHAGMHAGLALLELSIWRGVGNGLLVVPRIPMRTVLVERGVVTLDHAGTVRITPGATSAAAASIETATGRPRSTTQSEAEYFDRLRTRFPELVESFKTFLADLGEIGISPEYRRSVVLRFLPSPDITASAGFVDANGQAWLNDATSAATRAGRPDAAQRYLEAVAKATGGRVFRSSETSLPNVVAPRGTVLTLPSLLRSPSELKGAIARFVQEVNSATKSQA